MTKVVPFQLRIVEDINKMIKMDAMIKGITKHDWIQKAIQEKLEREKVV